VKPGAQDQDELSPQRQRFALSLLHAIRVSHLHTFENRAMVEPLSHLRGALDALITAEGAATILSTDGHLFVNAKRMGVSGELGQVLEKKGLGGLRFEHRLDTPGAKVLLEALHAIPNDTTDAPGFLRSFFTKSTDIGVTGLKRKVKDSVKTVSVPVSTRARLLYAKLLVLLREILSSKGEEVVAESFIASRLKRVLQEIVTTSEQAPLVFLGLVNVKNYEEYVANHSANVAVLSILLGRKIGLDRREVCDLAVASALHDLGRVELPAEAAAKPGGLDQAERAAIARHPVLGVRATLRRARTLDRTTMARIVATFEHNCASNGYPESRPVYALHIYSRIVSIVDAYDALTTARPYRRAFLPDEALAEIRKGIGSRFDATISRAFISLLGVYPHGSLVVLSTGEKAIVLHNDLSDVANPRPIVKVVLEKDGQSSDRLIDLGLKGPDGQYPATIVGTDDPARYGIAVAAFAAQ
jgi:HD-GYP domain-containing protein (c-di-GMP phosphodiesterase class II)